MLWNAAKPALNLLRRRPILAVVEFDHQDPYPPEREHRSNQPLMSREEIQQIFFSLHDEGIRFLVIHAGDLNARDDLFEILRDLFDAGFHLTVLTDGAQLTDNLISILASMRVSLSVSLDTLDRESYKRLTGTDRMRLALAGIERLSRYNHPRFISCTVSEQSEQEVEQVVILLVFYYFFF